MADNLQNESHHHPDVSVIVHRKPACHVELEVKASPQLVAVARQGAIKKIGKETVLPGFRKGHAPAELVVKRHPSAVENEWRKSIADAAFAAAQTQTRISVLSNTRVTFDLKKYSSEEGAELVFSFDSEPVVPSVNPKLFQPRPVQTIEIKDRQIDEAVYQSRLFFAQWKPVEDRGVQEGDYIIIDLETLEEPLQKVFDRIRFQVVKDRMAGWMQQLVLGAKAGAVLEGSSEADSDASEEEKTQFQSKKIRLTLHQVEEAQLPSMEDFIQKMAAADEADLRQSIQKMLEKNVQENVQKELCQQVNDFLLDQYPFEVPLSIIEMEKNHRLQQQREDPQFAEAYQKMDLDKKRQVDEAIYMKSVHATRLFYLTRQIAREAQLSITHQEVQEEAIRSVRAFGRKIDSDHLKKELFALALSRVTLAKVQDYILRNCAK
jgi:trigger factor